MIRNQPVCVLLFHSLCFDHWLTANAWVMATSTEQSSVHTKAWSATEKQKIKHGILQLFYDVEVANPSNHDDNNSILTCLMAQFDLAERCNEAQDLSRGSVFIPWKQLDVQPECLHIPGRVAPSPTDLRLEFYELFNSAAYAGYRYSRKANSCPPLNKQDAANHFADVWHAMFYELFTHSLESRCFNFRPVIDWPHALQHIYLPLHKRAIESERDTVTAAWEACQNSSKVFVSYSTQQREHGASANMALFARQSVQYTNDIEDDIVCRFVGEFRRNNEHMAKVFQEQPRCYTIESRRIRDRRKQRMLFYAGPCAANFSNSVERSQGNSGFETLTTANCQIMEYLAEDVATYIKRHRKRPAPFLMINRDIAAGEELVTTYGSSFYSDKQSTAAASPSAISQSNKRKADCIE